jgi:pimeloyl-ACP methyl ester carboxylesterase
MVDVSPVPTAERFTISLADGAIAGWRIRRRGAPRILFCHANGFCASAYKKMLAPLAQRFDVYAIDLRGHGRTTLPADPRALRDWRPYARDITAFLDHPLMEGEPWLLGGHSCGAVSASLAAKGRDDVRALVLIEPVATPPHVSVLARTPFWRSFARRLSLARNARARRRFWPDYATVRDSYARKALFQSWAEGVLEDYLEDGLREENGGVGLACAPEWEAASFTAQAHDFWGAVRRATMPVSVLGADHPGTTLLGRAAPRLRRLGAVVRLHGGASHLLPFEAPRIAADFIIDCAPAL